MAIELTERAAEEVKKIMQEQKLEEGTILRVGVNGGGCSGFSYSLGFATNYDEQGTLMGMNGGLHDAFCLGGKFDRIQNSPDGRLLDLLFPRRQSGRQRLVVFPQRTFRGGDALGLPVLPLVAGEPVPCQCFDNQSLASWRKSERSELATVELVTTTSTHAPSTPSIGHERRHRVAPRFTCAAITASGCGPAASP